MRHLVSLSLLCAALALVGCIGDEVATTGGAAADGRPTSITGTGAAAANAWTTPPPPGYVVQRPTVVQQAPAQGYAPVQPAPQPVVPTLPPAPSVTPPSPELPSWTPPTPPPVEESPSGLPEGGSGCGGGKG